jgi:hypothetical protein
MADLSTPRMRRAFLRSGPGSISERELLLADPANWVADFRTLELTAQTVLSDAPAHAPPAAARRVASPAEQERQQGGWDRLAADFRGNPSAAATFAPTVYERSIGLGALTRNEIIRRSDPNYPNPFLPSDSYTLDPRFDLSPALDFRDQIVSPGFATVNPNPGSYLAAIQRGQARGRAWLADPWPHDAGRDRAVEFEDDVMPSPRRVLTGRDLTTGSGFIRGPIGEGSIRSLPPGFAPGAPGGPSSYPEFCCTGSRSTTGRPCCP